MFSYDLNTYNTISAEIVVPVIIDIFKPSSVIDVGCGNGSWLKVFENQNVHITGIENSHIINAETFIDKNKIIITDLESDFQHNRTYDIVLCLEVAEHLSEKYAKKFIQKLCTLGDIIVFSAAVPAQGGYNHVNEQFLSYWIEIFKHYNFKCFDIIRSRITHHSNVLWWYKQNMVVFINSENHYSLKFKDFEILPGHDFVIKELYLSKVNTIYNIYNGSYSLSFYISLLLRKFRKKIKELLK
ncbi:MAG: methyltransferase domain-containing protein [Bacteroidales bacterium]